MSEITLTIDGKKCNGESGDTVLNVARKNDVYIPTLCFQEGLSPMGSCRMCVVEVEGSNKMLTSCTTPALDGMVVSTQTEKLFKYRKMILELLFAGRNHFCMFCSQSGDCELQTLAIEHGMDSVRYPYLYHDFQNDATSAILQIDHNRCILCNRCVRICAEKVGAHTLDLEQRGWSAKVTSDLGVAFGNSETCVECGACAQVCPTGTITVREFAYRGKRDATYDDIVASICPLCSMGCEIDGYVRTGSLARVDGTNLAGPDGGQLCHKGRWWLPESTERDRVTVPMVREGSTFREVSWDEALELAAGKLKEANNKDKAGAIISGMSTDEEMTLFNAMFKSSLDMKYVDCFSGDVLRGFKNGFKPFTDQGVRPFTAAHNILESDLVLTLEADPQEEAPVSASYVRVNTIRNGGKLANISSGKAPFKRITDVDIRVEQEDLSDILATLTEAVSSGDINKVENPDLVKLVSMLLEAERPVIIAGGELAKDAKRVTLAVNLAIAARGFFEDGIAVVPMVRSGNSLAAINTLVSDEAWVNQTDIDCLFVSSTGLVPETPESLEAMSMSRFCIVQTPYMVHPLVNMADVLLPSPAWYEKSGHFCTLEGERRKLNVIVPPAKELRGLSNVLEDISRKMGTTINSSKVRPCENVFVSSKSPDEARMAVMEEV